MGHVNGFVLALGGSAYATAVRLDAECAFDQTVLLVIASCYVLFAA